eukprot:scaffold193086_cov19-Tisochrysis_lutea.AAC.1
MRAKLRSVLWPALPHYLLISSVPICDPGRTQPHRQLQQRIERTVLTCNQTGIMACECHSCSILQPIKSLPQIIAPLPEQQAGHELFRGVFPVPIALLQNCDAAQNYMRLVPEFHVPECMQGKYSVSLRLGNSAKKACREMECRKKFICNLGRGSGKELLCE